MKFGKINKIKYILKTLVKNSRRLFFVVDCNKLFFEEFKRKHSYPIPTIGLVDLIGEVKVEISPFMSNFVGSDIMTIAMLKRLVSRYNPCSFLEIGTYYGITAQNMEAVVDNGFTIDIKKHRLSYHIPAKICQIINDSKKVDWGGLGFFNVIYVDGDHHYDYVLHDTKRAFEVLEPGGVIVFDDIVDKAIGYDRREWLRWDVIMGVYDGTPPEKRKNLYLVSNMCNLIYTEEPVKVLEEYADHILNIEMMIGERL